MIWENVPRRQLLVGFLGLGSVAMLGCEGMKSPLAPRQAETPPPAKPPEETITSAGPKKRVAILPFATKTVVQSLPNAGQTASEMLTTALFKTNQFIVVERDQLERVMREQGLGLSGAVDPSTAVKVGQILGVQALIMGSITQLGFSGQRTAVGGVQVGGKTAEAAVDVRAVDTTSAQLLLADTGTGRAATQGVVVGAYGQVSDAQETKLLGDSLRQATDDLARKLVTQLQRVAWAGRVAQVAGGSVYVNAGADLGLQSGMQLNIYRPGKEIIDPSTRQVLGREETQIGQLLIIDVKERFSIANASNGTGFQVNDIVRLGHSR